MSEKPGGKSKIVAKINFLFENPGGKIKIIVKYYFWLLLIASVILAIDFVANEEFILFIAFIIGGPIGAYLTALPLFAFGELVENSAKTADSLAQLQKISSASDSSSQSLSAVDEELPDL